MPLVGITVVFHAQLHITFPSFLPSLLHSFLAAFLLSFLPSFFASDLLLSLMLSHAISSEVTSPTLIDDHCMPSQSLISKLSVVAVVTNPLLKNLQQYAFRICAYIVCCSSCYLEYHKHVHVHVHARTYTLSLKDNT